MKISITIILLPVLLISCLEHAPIKTGFEGKKLPTFKFLLTDSTSILSTDSIKNGRSFILLYFSPNCPYCRAQIRDILKHDQQLQKTDFYFLTNYTCSEIKPMIEEFQLDKYKNITIAIDPNGDFVKYFFIPNIPYLAIYDKEKKLKQVYVGRTNFNEISKLL